MRTRLSVGVIVLMVIAAACGDGTTTTITSETAAATTTTAVAATTSTKAATTTTESTTTTQTPTTTSTATTAQAALSTVEAAVAYVEGWLAEDFASSEPPEGVLGPGDVVCDAGGSIPVGSVLACSLVPNTAPDLQLDQGGIVIYVLDASGRAAWTVGTDVPDSATGLADALAFAGTDWLCKDLMDPDLTTGLFGGAGRPADSAYFWSLVYWSLTGQPERMDADLNGTPCETLHDAAVVSQVLSGGPVR